MWRVECEGSIFLGVYGCYSWLEWSFYVRYEVELQVGECWLWTREEVFTSFGEVGSAEVMSREDGTRASLECC